MCRLRASLAHGGQEVRSDILAILRAKSARIKHDVVAAACAALYLSADLGVSGAVAPDGLSGRTYGAEPIGWKVAQTPSKSQS